MRACSWHARRGRVALLIAVPSVAAAVTAGIATPAHAATDYRITYPVTEVLTNLCNGEEVTLSGTAHEESHTTVDGNGGVHGTFHVHWSGVSGVDDLGNKYRATSTDVDSINSQVGYEETYIITYRLVSRGSAPNFTAREQFHITFNADGTMTSFHDNLSADPDCKG